MKRRADQLLYGLTAGFFAVKLGTLLVNALTFPRLRAAQRPVDRRVSVLVPARNEAQNLRKTLPLLLAQAALEVIVLDDGSTDGTADVARELGATAITGRPLPAGWVGKTWACQQLGQAARGDVLIFTDADVFWYPGALGAVVTERERCGAGLLSIFPKQNNQTLGERLLTPQIDTTLLSLFPAPFLGIPHYSAAAANGQVMVFTRETYERLGGYTCVKAELLEDVAFSRRVKGAGERLGLALGREFIGVRMYHSYPHSVRGLAKSILPMHAGRRELLVANVLLQCAFYTLPVLRRQPALVGLALAEALAVRLLTQRTRPAELAEVGLVPLVPLLYWPVVRRAVRRQVEWKGRLYDASTR